MAQQYHISNIVCSIKTRNLIRNGLNENGNSYDELLNNILTTLKTKLQIIIIEDNIDNLYRLAKETEM